MNKQAIISGLGLLVGLLGAHYFFERAKEDLSGGEPRAVLVLTRDLASGDLIDEGALETAWIPEAYVDGRRVPAKERPALLGVPLVNTIRAGEGLYWSDVAGGEDTAASLASLLTSGRRAFQLGPEANPFGTLVEVGNRVDVLCARGEETKTILERALVLAVGDRLRNDEEEKSKKTTGARTRGLSLSLLPEEAETLLKVERSCALRIVVRGTDDIALRQKPEAPRAPIKPVSSKTPEIEHVR